MIVPMKKITVLCLAGETESTLEKLRHLGALHILPVKSPDTENLGRIRADIERIQQARAILSTYEQENSGHVNRTPEEAVDMILGLSERRKKFEDRIRELETDHKNLQPLGNFDPTIVKSLSEKNVVVNFYYVPKGDMPEIPGEAATFEISRSKSGAYLAIVSRQKLNIDAQLIPVPSRSLDSIEKEIEQLKAQISEIDSQLQQSSAYSDSLEKLAADMENNSEYVHVRESMGESDTIKYLRGFCPVDKIDDIKKKAAENGWGLVIEEPSEEDRVPTLLRHPKWVKPLSPVLSFLGIAPGYKETDISPAFFLFLSIFFAMILGDAGYGIVILVTTLIVKHIKKIAFSESILLLLTFSISTTIWGLMTGNFFGINPELLPEPLQRIKVDWLLDQNHSMTFSLALGGIHLTIAHLWNIISRAGKNILKIIGQAGWIAIIWTMFMLARYLLLRAALPSFFMPFAITGLAAIVLSMALQKTWMDLAMLLLDIISNFGDLMSYLRLFALGIASVKVAEAFNTMAAQLGGSITGAMTLPNGYFAAAVPVVLILVFGHLLNLGLCMLSVLVHGIRLNTLEFSMHTGLEWSGFTYKPFAVKKSEVPVANAT